MAQRELILKDFRAVLAELDRLQNDGYTQLGQWNLAQICDHLAYFIDGSLDGYTFRVNWLFKTLFGRIALRSILSKRQMKSGIPTPQKPLPESGIDEAAAVARLRRAIERLEAHQGELHDSPFFGHLTPEEWRTLHLVHCTHHLAFLKPATR